MVRMVIALGVLILFFALTPTNARADFGAPGGGPPGGGGAIGGGTVSSSGTESTSGGVSASGVIAGTAGCAIVSHIVDSANDKQRDSVGAVIRHNVVPCGAAALAGAGLIALDVAFPPAAIFSFFVYVLTREAVSEDEDSEDPKTITRKDPDPWNCDFPENYDAPGCYGGR